MICPNCHYVFVPAPQDVHFDSTLCRRCRTFVLCEQPPGWCDIRPYKDRLRVVWPPEDTLPDYIQDWIRLSRQYH